jgi:hypothetical protein
MTPHECLQEIRAYTRRHPELLAAHHFLFDLRRPSASVPCDAIVIGLNPGEDSKDWDRHPRPADGGIHEESFEVDFMSPKERPWSRLIDFYCGSNATQSELFLWSSRDIAHFNKRFPADTRRKHFNFSLRMNTALLEYFRPRVVVAPGFNFQRIAKAQFDLRPCSLFSPLTRPEIGRKTDGNRLAEMWREPGGRLWIFTLHWGRRNALTKLERAILQAEIKNAVAHEAGF